MHQATCTATVLSACTTHHTLHLNVPLPCALYHAVISGKYRTASMYTRPSDVHTCIVSSGSQSCAVITVSSTFLADGHCAVMRVAMSRHVHHLPHAATTLHGVLMAFLSGAQVMAGYHCQPQHNTHLTCFATRQTYSTPSFCSWASKGAVTALRRVAPVPSCLSNLASAVIFLISLEQYGLHY